MESYFTRLHNRVLKVYGRCVRDCRVQVERVMNQYLWEYTAAVAHMREQNRRQEAITRHTLARIRADQACLKQECLQIKPGQGSDWPAVNCFLKGETRHDHNLQVSLI